MIINLPWPPTVNTYYAVFKGRKILSAKGRAYKKECYWLMAAKKCSKRDSGKFSVEIHAHPPDLRKRDLDNILKPVLDALGEYGAIPDDSDVDKILVVRHDVQKGGSIGVSVCEIM